MSKNRRKAGLCYNCQLPLTNGENYCPNCGQENHNRQASTRHLLLDFFNDYLSFDSKLFRSVVPLILKPGFMTNEFLDGKRMKYVPPIRLFIFLSFFYFGIIYILDQQWVGSFTIKGSEGDIEASREFMDVFQSNINIMIFAFTPIQALILMPFFRSENRRYYVNFFVYSLHLYSFLFILGIFFQFISWIFRDLDSESITNFEYVGLGFQLLGVIYLIYYCIRSLKRVFNKKYNILLFFIVLLMSILTFIIFFFGIILFIARLLGLL